MSITKRRIAVLVLAALIAATLVATTLLSSSTGTQTAAKAGGVVAVVADAKAKVAE